MLHPRGKSGSIRGMNTGNRNYRRYYYRVLRGVVACGFKI